MKEKVNEICLHPLISHICIVAYNYDVTFFGEQWEQIMCCHMSQFLVIKNILLLFWNNLKHLFLCLDGFNCDTWCSRNLPRGILIEFVWSKFKSVFRCVGWIKYLLIYIPTYPSKLTPI
jgi:hypothetical protein